MMQKSGEVENSATSNNCKGEKNFTLFRTAESKQKSKENKGTSAHPRTKGAGANAGQNCRREEHSASPPLQKEPLFPPIGPLQSLSELSGCSEKLEKVH